MSEKITSENIWTEDTTKDFYKKLLGQALDSIPESGAAMVLGPMFIIRKPEENFAIFEEAQNKLKDSGLAVFNQLPFVDHNLKEAPFKYGIKFETFYKPLIQSGKIKTCYLLPDWEKSEGTRGEIEYCKEAGIPIVEL